MLQMKLRDAILILAAMVGPVTAAAGESPAPLRGQPAGPSQPQLAEGADRAPAARAADSDKGEAPAKRAKEVALRFAAAFNEHRVDDMMKVAGLPFCYQPNGVPMGSTFGIPSPLVKTAKGLRRKLQEKVRGTLPGDIERIVKYTDYRDKLLVSADVRKVLDQVAGKDGMVVFLTKKGENGAVPLVVRLENSRAKVVGFVMTWGTKEARPAR